MVVQHLVLSILHLYHELLLKLISCFFFWAEKSMGKGFVSLCSLLF